MVAKYSLETRGLLACGPSSTDLGSGRPSMRKAPWSLLPLRGTESETAAVQHIPMLRSLMEECADAASKDGNSEILELTDQVMIMLSLWEQYLSYRKEMISQAHRNE